jgi:hypothetical protein
MVFKDLLTILINGNMNSFESLHIKNMIWWHLFSMFDCLSSWFCNKCFTHSINNKIAILSGFFSLDWIGLWLSPWLGLCFDNYLLGNLLNFSLFNLVIIFIIVSLVFWLLFVRWLNEALLQLDMHLLFNHYLFIVWLFPLNN